MGNSCFLKTPYAAVLLRAEREAFEQYKKDTLNVIKKQDNLNEEEDIPQEKSSKEVKWLAMQERNVYSDLYFFFDRKDRLSYKCWIAYRLEQTAIGQGLTFLIIEFNISSYLFVT